jgi:hypothetical protein
MYTTIRHELSHARKAWPGILADPCLLFVGDSSTCTISRWLVLPTVTQEYNIFNTVSCCHADRLMINSGSVTLPPPPPGSNAPPPAHAWLGGGGDLVS